MDPQPAPVDRKMVLALKTSANTLWYAVLKDLLRTLDDRSRRLLVKAVLPDTRMRVAAVFGAHPDWSPAEIAEAAGVHPGTAYRHGLKNMQANNKARAEAEAKERAPRAYRVRKETGASELEAISPDNKAKAFPEDDECVCEQ
jgi:hypothetical protein